MFSKYEADIIEKGIELSWTTWSKMRDESLTLGDISYLKATTDRGFERIFSVKINEKDMDFRIQQMISYIKAGIMPDSILITPNTQPPNLAELLSQKGFSIDDPGSCMMMRIDDYVSQTTFSNNIEVINVLNKEQLRTWLDIVNVALFDCELVTIEQFNDILNLDNTYFYLGILEGKAVTSCMTILDGDTSVLELVATLKEYRRKGIATVTIDKALIDLRKRDIKTISLRAETSGINVYRRIGFKECFLRTVATCDWDKVYKEACPYRIEDYKVEKAKMIFDQSSDIQSFVKKMNNESVIGKRIWYEQQEKAIYIEKMYACDCGGGCLSNKTIIGQRCHCEYINHLNKSIPLSYCKCSAAFFEPIFTPLFGENILIEPVKTVLSGSDKCIFKIKLDV